MEKSFKFFYCMEQLLGTLTFASRNKFFGGRVPRPPVIAAHDHRRSAQVWHMFSRDLTVLSAHAHVHPQSEWAIPAFAFPAIAGSHLPTRKDGRLSWPGWLVTQWDSLPARNQSSIPVLTGLNVQQLRWSRPTRYRYTKPPPKPKSHRRT